MRPDDFEASLLIVWPSVFYIVEWVTYREVWAIVFPDFLGWKPRKLRVHPSLAVSCKLAKVFGMGLHIWDASDLFLPIQRPRNHTKNAGLLDGLADLRPTARPEVLPLEQRIHILRGAVIVWGPAHGIEPILVRHTALEVIRLDCLHGLERYRDVPTASVLLYVGPGLPKLGVISQPALLPDGFLSGTLALEGVPLLAPPRD